jgi:hypothetical protein
LAREPNAVLRCVPSRTRCRDLAAAGGQRSRGYCPGHLLPRRAAPPSRLARQARIRQNAAAPTRLILRILLSFTEDERCPLLKWRASAFRCGCCKGTRTARTDGFFFSSTALVDRSAHRRPGRRRITRRPRPPRTRQCQRARRAPSSLHGPRRARAAGGEQRLTRELVGAPLMRR